MSKSSWLIVTSIAHPTEAVKAFAQMVNWQTLVVGDVKTPANWTLDKVDFLSLEEQFGSDISLARLLPKNHYSRKNIGYLHAIHHGARRIAESDDDNFPLPGFLSNLSPAVSAPAVGGERWVNVYRYFAKDRIWPRGYPLELIGKSFTDTYRSVAGDWDCPVQQFLADGDPDVDAVYRLTVGDDHHRFTGRPVVLDVNSYTPFNSQSTVWFPEAYVFMYLPSFVSFRMTDIWRSFVAQACLHAKGMRLAYHPPGVRQDRNVHNLLHDFAQEVPGYLANFDIVELLASLPLSREKGPSADVANLTMCYSALVSSGHVPAEEMSLLAAWLEDFGRTPR